MMVVNFDGGDVYIGRPEEILVRLRMFMSLEGIDDRCIDGFVREASKTMEGYDHTKTPTASATWTLDRETAVMNLHLCYRDAVCNVHQHVDFGELEDAGCPFEFIWTERTQ